MSLDPRKLGELWERWSAQALATHCPNRWAVQILISPLCAESGQATIASPGLVSCFSVPEGTPYDNISGDPFHDLKGHCVQIFPSLCPIFICKPLWFGMQTSLSSLSKFSSCLRDFSSLCSRCFPSQPLHF